MESKPCSTASLLQLDHHGCPEIKKEEQAVLNTAFSDLQFQSGKDVILAESYSSLNQLAGLLKQKPEWMLKLTGYTDNQGNRTMNIFLSRNRTLAVKKYLTAQGVEGSRIVTAWRFPTAAH